MGEADFYQFTGLQNELRLQQKIREENLSWVQIPKFFKDVHVQISLAHRVVEVAGRSNRPISVTLLRYIGEKPKKWSSGERWFARTKEEGKTQQIVHVNYKLNEIKETLSLMISVLDKVIKTTVCNVPEKVTKTFYSWSIFSRFQSRCFWTVEVLNLFFKENQNSDFIMLY